MGGGPRILIVGGGYGGMHTALCLERLLRPGEATVTIADPRSYMTYQPLLAEAAAGNLEPRHVVVPLRGVLRRTQVIKAAVSSVDHGRRAAHLASGDGAERTVGYDLLVLAPGSVSRVLPIPGLAEAGIGFKTIGEAIHLRNHVLGRLDAAAAAASDDVRRAALTFVFAGGGYAGVEALAELQDMAFGACARYPELSPRDMRWILVEAADRILPEVSTKMAGYTTDLLRRRHIEVRLQTRLASAGSVASLGLYRGVAEVYGLRMHGFPAWMTHRTYHLLRLPTLNRRLHVVSDWTLALLFSREIVFLDVLEHPRQDFQAALDLIASGPPQAPAPAGTERAGSADREEGEAVHHAHHQQAEGVPPGRAANADAGQAAPSGNGPGMSEPGSTDGWARACPLAKLLEDRPVHVDIGQCPVCVVRSNGTVYALRDECTHQAVPLSDGEVTDGTIECWLHGSRFDLSTGRALSRPATQPVDVYPVRIHGDDVLVRLDVHGNSLP
jgi:NADH dehydrogenase FAD-containing subunit/nitrite reductase/ring-hydroxylating ferredoxin subunit